MAKSFKATIAKNLMRKNGEISVMPKFSPDQFLGVMMQRKANYPAVRVQLNEKEPPIATTFNLTEYAEGHPEQTKDLGDGRVEVTFPESMYAEQGDRFPHPVSGPVKEEEPA